MEDRRVRTLLHIGPPVPYQWNPAQRSRVGSGMRVSAQRLRALLPKQGEHLAVFLAPILVLVAHLGVELFDLGSRFSVKDPLLGL